MPDIASLGIAVDSRDAGKASKDLDALATASKKAEAAVQNLRKQAEPGLGAIQAAAKRAGVTVDEMRERMANAQQNLAKNFPQWVKVQQEAAAKAARAVQDLGAANSDLDDKQKRTDASGRNLADTLTRRVIYGLVASQARAAAVAVAELNGQIARAGDIGKLTGMGPGNVQGIISAAGAQGIDNNTISAAMIALTRQIPLAKAGVGELGQLLRANKITVTDTSDAFFKVADLVARAKDGAAQFSILQQAGLPATTEMVRLMSQGGDALRKQIADSPKLTDAQVKAAQEIRDTWNKTWQAFYDNGTFAIAGLISKMGELETAGSKAISNSSFANAPIWKAIAALGSGGINEWVRSKLGTPEMQPAEGTGQPSGGPLRITVNKSSSSPSGENKPSIDWANEKLKAQDAISKAQQYLGLFGATTSAEEARHAVELQLQAAGLNGVRIDAQRAETLKQLAYETNLGITAIKASTDAQNVAAATIGMSAGAAAAYTAVQNALNEAKRNGKFVTDAQKAAIEAEAEVLGRATQRVDNLRFEYDTFSGTMREVGANIRQGGLNWQAFGNAGVNALGRIADRLMDMGSRGLWEAAFGGSGGGIGGVLGSLFKIGSGTTMGLDGLAAIHHSGYGPGDPIRGRYVHPAYFDNAPRFHSGIGPGERAAIIRNDESVLTPGQMRALAPAGSGGANVSITNNYDFRGADAGVEARLKAYVDQTSQRTVQQAVDAVSQTHRMQPTYLGNRQ